MSALATVVVFQRVHVLIWKSFNLFYLRDSLTGPAQFVGDRAVPGSKPGVYKTCKLLWCWDTFRAPLHCPVRYQTPRVATSGPRWAGDTFRVPSPIQSWDRLEKAGNIPFDSGSELLHLWCLCWSFGLLSKYRCECLVEGYHGRE